MTDRLYIAVDMDDCLLDFSTMLRSAIWEEFAVEVPPFEAWEISHVLDPIVGKEWLDEWLRERPSRWAAAPWIPGAFGALTKLREAGHVLEIVTQKPEWAEPLTWEWIGRNHPPVTRVTIIGLGGAKSEITDADVLIDDNLKHCNEFVADGRVAILFTRSHNEGQRELSEGVTRADTWKEILRLVEQEVDGGLD